MTDSRDNGRATGVIYINFNKTFDTGSHSTLVAEPGEKTQLASSTERLLQSQEFCPIVSV